jgi:hypothetical protein
MKRGKPSTFIANWKQAYPREEKPAKAESHQNRNSASLALIKKSPVTFQLSRLENPKDFELMGFVIKACAKTADYPFKTILHVEQSRTGSRLVACDGLRLHVAEISKKIKSGNYKPHVTKDIISLGKPVKDIKFPQWSKSIPINAVKRGVINLEESGMGADRKMNEKLSIAFNDFARQTGEAVNLRFLEDLPKRKWVVYSHDEKGKLIVLKLKSGKAREPDEKSPVAVIRPIDQAA